MEVKYENKEICKECGGKCCKKCGCDYLPKDFEDLSTNGLLERITGGGGYIYCIYAKHKYITKWKKSD